ncbi:MAG: hypothetical protein JSS53_07570 [Proteobacteria bacterium]|nr:hypothetical protein [Pseudomonadota bacterium]
MSKSSKLVRAKSGNLRSPLDRTEIKWNRLQTEAARLPLRFEPLFHLSPMGILLLLAVFYSPAVLAQQAQRTREPEQLQQQPLCDHSNGCQINNKTINASAITTCNTTVTITPEQSVKNIYTAGIFSIWQNDLDTALNVASSTTLQNPKNKENSQKKTSEFTYSAYNYLTSEELSKKIRFASVSNANTLRSDTGEHIKGVPNVRNTPLRKNDYQDSDGETITTSELRETLIDFIVEFREIDREASKLLDRLLQQYNWIIEIDDNKEPQATLPEKIMTISSKVINDSNELAIVLRKMAFRFIYFYINKCPEGNTYEQCTSSYYHHDLNTGLKKRGMLNTALHKDAARFEELLKMPNSSELRIAREAFKDYQKCKFSFNESKDSLSRFAAASRAKPMPHSLTLNEQKINIWIFGFLPHPYDATRVIYGYWVSPSSDPLKAFINDIRYGLLLADVMSPSQPGELNLGLSTFEEMYLARLSNTARLELPHWHKYHEQNGVFDANKVFTTGDLDNVRYLHENGVNEAYRVK